MDPEDLEINISVGQMTVRSYSPMSRVDISLKNVDPENLKNNISVGQMTIRNYSPISRVAHLFEEC